MKTTRESLILTPIGSGTGIIISPASPARGISSLLEADLYDLLADAGHIVIRGFNPTTEEFNDLVRHYSSRTTLDPAREFHGNAAQKVDSGHGPIGLHIENGMTPFAPDLLWFYCVKAASSGSQTTVCDGFRVWDSLTEGSRKLFADQPLRYTRRNIPAVMWQRLAAVLSGNGAKPEDMTVADLYRLANKGSEVEFTEQADGSITYEYLVHAAHPTYWSDRMAWANSILGPSYNYEAPDIRFADGTAIPEDITAEYTEVSEQLTEEIAWEDGDIVLIDNTRVMHGRRAITDPNRTILNAQSYARR